MKHPKIVVTGGSGGLGRHVVRHLAPKYSIFTPLFEPNPIVDEGWEEVTQTTGISLMDEKAVTPYFDKVGFIKGAVILAGGFAMSPLISTSVDDMEKMWRLNFITAFLTVREAAKKMPEGGSMILVSARPTIVPVAGMIAYSASKAAVSQLVKSAAVELAEHDIRVNAIVPSIIDTAVNRKSMPDADHSAWPKPHEISEVIKFLLSDASKLTTGTMIPVYGKS